MIYFVVRDAIRWGIDDFLAEWGQAMADRIGTISYEELPARSSLPFGAYIFTQRDDLLPSELEMASVIWDHLSLEPGIRLLNDPRRAMGRFELLQTLHAKGYNDFKVVKAVDELAGLHFPVFVREERHHTGSLTDLLQSPAELDQALGNLLVRGWRRADLLVVEFCHTADDHDIFRKYSAYVVASEIIPRSIAHSEQWMVKAATKKTTQERADEEFDYVIRNPHREWLSGVMETAHIEYGRIDYGMKGDRPQAWEINLYPTLVMPRSMPRSIPEHIRAMRKPARKQFFDEFQTALEAIDPGHGSGTDVPIHLPTALKERLESDRRRERLRTLHRAATKRVAGWRLVHPLWRLFRPLVSKVSGTVARVSRPG